MTRENTLKRRRRKRRNQRIRRKLIRLTIVLFLTFSISLEMNTYHLTGVSHAAEKVNNPVSVRRTAHMKKLRQNAAEMAKKRIRNVDPEKPMVALTFDDGPGIHTDKLLKVLERYGARATFFMVGPNVKHYSKTVKKMYDMGCELGNHTTTHPQLTKLDGQGIRKEIETTNRAVQKAAGSGPVMMRPPYGAMNKTVRANAKMPLILWSIDTLDWKTKSKEATVQSILSKKNLDGEIVLMHDSHEWSVEAAIEVIPKLVRKGYQLVTVGELAKARGIDLKDGGRYAQFLKK